MRVNSIYGEALCGQVARDARLLVAFLPLLDDMLLHKRDYLIYIGLVYAIVRSQSADAGTAS